MFAAKTTNRGKLDSHCWFFDGFAYLLQPDFCVLFDAGEGRGRGQEGQGTGANNGGKAAGAAAGGSTQGLVAWQSPIIRCTGHSG